MLGIGISIHKYNAGDRYAVSEYFPDLVSDFNSEYYRKSGVACAFSDLFTFARPGPATYVDATGTRRTAADGEPRLGHHVYEGGQWVNKGLLIESEARTNLFLNSATLSTQGVTTTAQAYTVSFTGTGTITFSGAHTGSLVGIGAGEENRVVVTFTPSAGTVTCTVAGTVTNAQCEEGSTPSSYIPTTGSTATRAAETLTIPAAKLPYSSTAMSIAMKGTMTYAVDQSDFIIYPWRWHLSATEKIYPYFDVRSGVPNLGGALWFVQETSDVVDVVMTSGGYYAPGVNVPFSIASRHGATFINGAVDGSSLTPNETPTALPDLSATDLQLAYDFMGTIEEFRMWDADLGDTGIAEASS